jgi:hypothetical protein
MRRLLQLYNHRIVNVNVNVIAAGILALGPTVLVVHLSRHIGVDDNDRFLITLITFVADLVSDVSIYFGLHWLANHRPGVRRLSQVDQAYRQMSFLRDAGVVQMQRAILSPLLYTVAFGTLYALLHAGWARELASAVGLIAGIILTRILHTVWMLRWERKALEKLRLVKPLDGEIVCPINPAGAASDGATNAGAKNAQPDTQGGAQGSGSNPPAPGNAPHREHAAHQ